MSPSRVRSQPSPRWAHGCWTKQVREHDALVDPLPLTVPDTWLRPVGCSGPVFCELISPTMTACASWTWPVWSRATKFHDGSLGPGDAFHLDLDGTVVAGRYMEVDPPHRLVIGWDRPAGADQALPPYRRHSRSSGPWVHEYQPVRAGFRCVDIGPQRSIRGTKPLGPELANVPVGAGPR